MEKLEEYRGLLFKELTISLFFLYLFIKGKLFGDSHFYNMLDLSLGTYYYLFIFCPLLLIGIGIKKNKKRRRSLKIRLYSAILFLFFCSYIYVLKAMELYPLTNTATERVFVELTWDKLKLGGIATYIMHYGYFNLDKKILLNSLIGGAVFTSFIAFTKFITDSMRGLKGMMKQRRERLELERRNKELHEKISIKEELDKKMSIKKKKTLEQKKLFIQEKVDKYIEEEEPISFKREVVVLEENLDAEVVQETEEAQEENKNLVQEESSDISV